ncbi:hypothetical protein VP01_3161g1 [Puccinia sorghi]|uniref:Uncharacterized protein n=1 Tax=Puccinia sorghi TaxID=27349 RepID=A0A0L6UYS9_9BASI|nr:hypothetical protein VP01_3161g1 [Puccinia sorghi]
MPATIVCQYCKDKQPINSHPTSQIQADGHQLDSPPLNVCLLLTDLVNVCLLLTDLVSETYTPFNQPSTRLTSAAIQKLTNYVGCHVQQHEPSKQSKHTGSFLTLFILQSSPLIHYPAHQLSPLQPINPRPDPRSNLPSQNSSGFIMNAPNGIPSMIILRCSEHEEWFRSKRKPLYFLNAEPNADRLIITYHRFAILSARRQSGTVACVYGDTRRSCSQSASQCCLHQVGHFLPTWLAVPLSEELGAAGRRQPLPRGLNINLTNPAAENCRQHVLRLCYCGTSAGTYLAQHSDVEGMPYIPFFLFSLTSYCNRSSFHSHLNCNADLVAKRSVRTPFVLSLQKTRSSRLFGKHNTYITINILSLSKCISIWENYLSSNINHSLALIIASCVVLYDTVLREMGVDSPSVGNQLLIKLTTGYYFVYSLVIGTYAILTCSPADALRCFFDSCRALILRLLPCRISTSTLNQSTPGVSETAHPPLSPWILGHNKFDFPRYFDDSVLEMLSLNFLLCIGLLQPFSTSALPIEGAIRPGDLASQAASGKLAKGIVSYPLAVSNSWLLTSVHPLFFLKKWKIPQAQSLKLVKLQQETVMPTQCVRFSKANFRPDIRVVLEVEETKNLRSLSCCQRSGYRQGQGLEREGGPAAHKPPIPLHEYERKRREDRKRMQYKGRGPYREASGQFSRQAAANMDSEIDRAYSDYMFYEMGAESTQPSHPAPPPPDTSGSSDTSGDFCTGCFNTDPAFEAGTAVINAVSDPVKACLGGLSDCATGTVDLAGEFLGCLGKGCMDCSKGCLDCCFNCDCNCCDGNCCDGNCLDGSF